MSDPFVGWVLGDHEGEPQRPACKGRYYRCRVTWYQKPSTGAYVNTVEFRPLKSLSCPGCESCGWFDEYIRESDGMFDYPEHPEDFTVYKLEVTEGVYCWDTWTQEPEAVGFVLDEPPDAEIAQ